MDSEIYLLSGMYENLISVIFMVIIILISFKSIRYTLNSKERIKHSMNERNILREHSFFLSVEKFKNTQKVILWRNILAWEIIFLWMKPKALLLDKNFERGDWKALPLIGFCHVYRFPLLPYLVYGEISWTRCILL